MKEKMHFLNSRSEELYNLAKKSGYEVCGIISIDSTKEYADDLDKRLMNVPEAENFYKNKYAFADMKKKFPWAKSILICGYWYGKYKVPKELKYRYGRAYLMDARLDSKSDEYKARVDLEKGMHVLNYSFRGDRLNDITCFRKCAEKAGLGRIRENNFFYTKKGSWIYMDAWVIEEELEAICVDEQPKECPPDCGLCRKACKTGTLCKSNTMNPYKCTSYISALNIDIVPESSISNKLGEWIYGCDDCQNACPYNKFTEEVEEFPLLNEHKDDFTPEGILMASDKKLKEIVQPKFWYVKPDQVWKFRIMAMNSLSNAKIKLANYYSLLEISSKNDNKEVQKMAVKLMKKYREM